MVWVWSLAHVSVVVHVADDQGGTTSSKKHVKNLHSILRYAERSQRLNKWALVVSKFAGVQYGVQCFEHLF